MSEEIKVPEQSPAPEQPEQKPAAEPQLSPRRRTALVTYLAILFAVAFLFVAIMMVAETKRLKTMNQELQHDSQKNAASLTSNINALQEENQKLSEENGKLSARITELEDAARQAAQTAETEKAELQARLESAAAEQARLQQELEAASQKALDAVEVSELLHQALAADEAGELEELQSLLSQIEPLKELLSETEQELFEELKIA